jgi:hypothetical protein
MTLVSCGVRMLLGLLVLVRRWVWVVGLFGMVTRPSR